MPFLPLVVLIAWQALSRSTSFLLGWATALYFGQVPGRQGRILSVVSLASVAWVVLLIGFAVPILSGAALEATGVIADNFDVRWYHYLGLMAGVVGIPPAVAAAAVIGGFHAERDVATWLRLVPRSYPATFMLGLSVLQMVAFTPILLFRRWREKKDFIQVPLVMRKEADDDDLVDAVRDALHSIGIEDVAVAEERGIVAWPMRTVGYAVRHLLGAVVRGDPMRLAADGLRIYAYATNISVTGPKELAYRLRAAVERELAFSDAYLTWSDDAQSIEDELMAAHADANGDLDALRTRLERIQHRMDGLSLNSEEWNVLYRLRLQVEQAAARTAAGQPERERVEA